MWKKAEKQTSDAHVYMKVALKEKILTDLVGISNHLFEN